MVESYNHFRFVTGVFRVRIWIDGENWSAAWSDGVGTWPATGEIDAWETLNNKGCYHVHDTSGGPGGCPVAATPGWHTIKYVRTTSSVTFFYDKVNVGSISTAKFAAAEHYLILSQQLSSSISPPIVVPSEMRVDWVEVDPL